MDARTAELVMDMLRHVNSQWRNSWETEYAKKTCSAMDIEDASVADSILVVGVPRVLLLGYHSGHNDVTTP